MIKDTVDDLVQGVDGHQVVDRLVLALESYCSAQMYESLEVVIQSHILLLLKVAVEVFNRDFLLVRNAISDDHRNLTSLRLKGHQEMLPGHGVFEHGSTDIFLV